MKPQRMRITHELVSAYGMLDHMQVLVRASFSSPTFPRLLFHFIFRVLSSYGIAKCAPFIYVFLSVEGKAGVGGRDDQVSYG